MDRIEKKWEQMAGTIIDAVESYERTGKWVRPWKISQHRNMFTGTVYKGINTFLLMMTPYECPLWGTFNQWSKAGYRIKKGVAGEIVWSNPYHRKEDDDGNVSITYGRSYPIYIFNGEQIEGFEWESQPIELDADIHNALTAKNPTIVSDDKSRAYYSPSRDVINLPPQNSFNNAESYFAVLAHELIHWTGAEARLNRSSVINYSKDLNRSFEELVAEIGSAILGNDLGFASVIQDNELEYIKGWLTLLKNEKDALKAATTEALSAVRFLR